MLCLTTGRTLPGTGETVLRWTKTQALQLIRSSSAHYLGHVAAEGGPAVDVGNIFTDAVENRHVLVHLSSLREHDSYTFGHSINVCIFSVMIGLKMRLPGEQLSEIAIGALLHDLGKLLIPPEILTKRGPLTADEWRRVRRHCEDAFALLGIQRGLPFTAAQIAGQHHENYDGSGYPRGLAGEQIHPYARIVAVADNFDAVTTDRPYRRAFLPHQAGQILRYSQGTKLDPRVVDAFFEALPVCRPRCR